MRESHRTTVVPQKCRGIYFKAAANRKSMFTAILKHHYYISQKPSDILEVIEGGRRLAGTPIVLLLQRIPVAKLGQADKTGPLANFNLNARNCSPGVPRT
jgi:hypothetical protein